jgi:hypothetical protein
MNGEERVWIVNFGALSGGELSDTDSPFVGTRDAEGAQVPISVIAAAVHAATRASVMHMIREAIDKI